MNSPRVVMMSLWRNDAARRVRERAQALLSKTYAAIRWVWVVGDSEDDTLDVLIEEAARKQDDGRNREVVIVVHNTGITGNDANTRLLRLSRTVNAGLGCVRDDDDLWLIHESDIDSPPDIIERLLAAGHVPVGAWPTLEVASGDKIFYDTWAYRAGGQHFSGRAQFHTVYRPDTPFIVESVGT